VMTGGSSRWVVRGSLARVVHSAVLRGARRFWHDLRFRDLYRSGKEFELMHRALGFAALATLTLIPLLILVAAANPAPHGGLAAWVIYGMGLTGSSADAVTGLFSAPARVLGTTSVLSALLVGFAGVAFAGNVQAGYEKIWGLPVGPWHKIWRQAVWLAALVAYIYAAATVGTVTHQGPLETAGRVAVAVVLGIVFFWWGLRFLIGGRVSYLASLPGAVATVVCLGGLRGFSGLVFEPLIARNAVSYGALGSFLIVQSWLIGVGWVVFGGQLFGRWFHDAWLEAWANRGRAKLADAPMSGSMKQMTDRATVSRWVAEYEAAWRAPGTEGLAGLFAGNATYLKSPYEQPVNGLAAIKRMWEEEREGPDEVFTLVTDIIAVDGPMAVVRAEVRYGDPAVQEYRDLWVIRLAGDGRCTRFEEWPHWPGRPYSAGDDVSGQG
jgi:membrane protein